MFTIGSIFLKEMRKARKKLSSPYGKDLTFRNFLRSVVEDTVVFVIEVGVGELLATVEA